MSTSFDRWEKDPFFSAAEEVQASADRMESAYRTWIHALKDPSTIWDCNELQRDLRTTLGTTKWQLEEFQKAVGLSYAKTSKEDDSKQRHREFIFAMTEQVSKMEISLKDSAISEGKPSSSPWVHLDEDESNELAMFISGPLKEKIIQAKNQETDKESAPGCSEILSHSAVSSGSLEPKKEIIKEKPHGHRRTASASADIGTWHIAITDDGNTQKSVIDSGSRPPRKTPSFSGFLNSMEYPAKFKWPKNGARKWKATDRHEDSDTEMLKPPRPQLSRGIISCYERSKGSLSCEDCYDKQLYSWSGALQRQLQSFDCTTCNVITIIQQSIIGASATTEFQVFVDSSVTNAQANTC
ncbi:hypothetical protein ACFE04_006129 [Oxalis oulophora]